MGATDRVKCVLFSAMAVVAQQIVAASSLPPARDNSICIPALFQFGDSLSDTGNAGAVFPLAITALNPPYGQKRFKIPTGRFSDGYLVIDFIALALDLPLLSPYLRAVGADFSNGVDFSFAGATALNVSFFSQRNVSTFVPFSLMDEYAWYLKFRRDAAATLAMALLLPNPLYYTQGLYVAGEIGGNDYTILLLSGRFSIQQVISIVPNVVGVIKQTIQNLYASGARLFLVPNIPTLGCTPLYLTVFASNSSNSYDPFGCLTAFENITIQHNEQLLMIVTQLRLELTNALIVYADYNRVVRDVLTNPSKYGLHCEHQESVRVKLIGLPSFLYNFSTDCLYGAFEATYEGGLKPALPDLWQRNLCKNGQPSALRNNSKVRIHMCKLRDLPQGNLPFVTDATNVMSELSFSEVKNLLTILSVSSLNISEEIEDENDDGWKKVKSKYQSRRQVHPDFSKGFSSPNRLSGRRQGTHSSSTQNGAEDSPVSHNKNSFRYKTSRGSYENRADATENWRTESKIGNQFRSANVLKLPLCEDVQIYKGYEQSGANGETADLHSQRDPTTQFCSSAREVDFQQLSRNDSSSVDSPGESESMQNICVKSSFESYSAALKSGIHDDGSDTCTVTQIVSRGESNSSNRSEGAGSTDSCSSPCSVNGFPFSAVSELQWGETLTDPQFLSELNSKHGYSSDDNHNMLPLSDTSDEQCNHKQFVGIFSNADGSESATTGCEEEEHGSRNRSGSARDHKRSSMTPKHASETPCNIEKDEEIPTHDQPANFDLSGSEGNEFPGNSWMNGELSTSGRFYDPDPAVNSGNVVLDSFPGQRIGAENCGQPPPHQRPHQLYPSLRMRGRSQGVRLPDSKQFPFSVPSKACYTKTSMPKLLRQGKRAQESHRRNAEGLQHIYHEGTARQQSRNRKPNVPWPLTRATDCRAYLPCPFPFPSFDLLQNPQLIHPPPQMHWGMQSPFLLFLPTISPLIGITSTVLPLPPPVQSGRAFLETLHADILKFAKVTRPAANIRAGVESAIMCVSDTVKQLWPGADVEVFGSFSTGLCLSHSDVDVAVTLASTLSTTNSSSNTRPHGVAPLIRELAASLCQHPWCENLSTIETASMPVIKLECRTQLDNCPTSNSSVAIDITISGKRRDCTRINHKNPAMTGVGPRVAHNGAAARDYVVGKLCQFPALAPLVLVMKSYLDHRKLNDVYSGGLGSFALTLLLVFYLERVSTPCEVMEKLPATTASMQESTTNNLLQPPDNETSDSSIPNRDSVSAPAPCQGSDSSQFSEILNRADRIVTEALGSMESSNIMNLATLLLGFLHTFGHHINLSSVRLVLKGTEDSPNGLLPLPQIASPVALWIEDPLNPGANVGAGSFNMWHVQAAMRDMFYVLTKSNCNLSSLPSENDSSSGRCLLGQLFMPSTRPQAA